MVLPSISFSRRLTVLLMMQFTSNRICADGYGPFQNNLTDLSDKMDILCPYNAICRTGSSVLQLDGDRDSCCGDCSCDETCGLTNSCCFPEQDLYDIVDRSRQQCTPVSTYRPDSSSYQRRDYYMVVGGNGEECDTSCLPFEDDDGATVLGSLYPVSSNTTGTIYINEQCALCNGVNTTDLLPWEAVLSCKPPSEDYLEVYVGTYLQTLETGKLHPSCYLEFSYPGPTSDVSNKRCFENAVRTCKSEPGQRYDIPAELSMTEDQVRAACLSGLRVHYMHRYFNIFCYMCNYGPFYPTRQCDLTDDWRGPISHLAFSSVLDSSILEKKTKDAPVMDEKILSACKLQTTTVCSDDCREVHCPSGQFPQGPSCVYPDLKVLDADFVVVLNLYPQSKLRTDTVETYLDANSNWKTVLSNKRLRKWTIKHLYYKTKPCRDDGDCVDYFWMKLSLRVTNGKNNVLRTTITNVGKFMRDKLTMLINDSNVPLQPMFSDFHSVVFSSRNNIYRPEYMHWQLDEIPPILKNMDLSTLTPIITGPSKRSTSTITKMFFCDQVSLRNGEYHLDTLFRFLYLNESDRLIFPGEFTLGYDIEGGVVPRLCLKDAGFAVLPDQTSASPQHLPPNACTLVLVMMIVHTMGQLFQ